MENSFLSRKYVRTPRPDWCARLVRHGGYKYLSVPAVFLTGHFFLVVVIGGICISFSLFYRDLIGVLDWCYSAVTDMCILFLFQVAVPAPSCCVRTVGSGAAI